MAAQPGPAELLCNRAAALRDAGRLAEALASFDEALAARPDYPEALIDRGNVLQGLDRTEDALASYGRALHLKPGDPIALSNRAAALQRLRRFPEALADADAALRAQPQSAPALNNRGNILQDLRRFDEAIESYRGALALAPNYPDALNNCGNALRAVRRHEEAAACYVRLLAIAPQYVRAKGNLLFARMACCDWRDFSALVASVERELASGGHGVGPFEYLAISSSVEAQRRCAEIHAAVNLPPAAVRRDLPARSRHDRIRVGYVCGEFRRHATAQLIVELLERHDARRFEVHAFDNGWDDGSDLRRRIEAAVGGIVDISGLSDAAACAEIEERQIDILVDLNGYCGFGRLGVLARRAAPVQASWLGFAGTLGARCIDYIVADVHVIPPEHAPLYAEKVVWLPGSYQVSDTTRPIGAAPGRAAAGLPQTGFVFASFNNNYKITPDVFEAWMRLLARVPESVLWLLEDNAAVSRNLRHEARQRGIAPERLVFAPRIDHGPHLARCTLADLMLDTAPLNGHTTASDALWAGVPVVTLSGNAFAGRVAGSLLNAIGLPELVTTSLAGYEALALELATRPLRLQSLRARLSENRGTRPLFDTDRFCGGLEAAFVTMWERCASGAPPQSFAVPA